MFRLHTLLTVDEVDDGLGPGGGGLGGGGGDKGYYEQGEESEPHVGGGCRCWSCQMSRTKEQVTPQPALRLLIPRGVAAV